MKPKAVLAYCREKDIRAVDLRFSDLGGAWKHVTFPVSALTESVFETGFGQEVTLRGIAREPREQMILVPIAEANYVDPMIEQPTLVLLSHILDALTRDESWMDSRAVASRASQFLQSTGIADSVQVRALQPFSLQPTRGADAEDGMRPSSQHYLACGSSDVDFTFRCELASLAFEAGVSIERHYRAQRSTSEVVLGASALPDICDDLLMIRYLIENLAGVHGRRLVHANLASSSQWVLLRGGEAIFSGLAQQGLSEIGWYAVGGILHHATSLAAIALASPFLDCSTEYRWQRSVAPTDPDALCNVIVGSHDPRQRAIEYRGAPSVGNPYLQMAAVLMAMIDGIQNKYTLPGGRGQESAESDNHFIGTNGAGVLDLKELQDSLHTDTEYLLAGGVFTEALLQALHDYLSPTALASHN